MIINVIKNLDYEASPRLDMIINVMKISIKKNYYQASPRLDMIIKDMKKKL